MSKKIGIYMILLVVALASACSSKRQVAAEKIAPVKGVQIERASMSGVGDYYEAVGTVRAKTTTILSSKVIGNIIALHVREGDGVRAGQTLVEIDNRDASAQLQKARAGALEAEQAIEEIERTISGAEAAKQAAQASFRLSTATFNRYSILLERRSVSQQEFEEVQAKKQVAEAELDRANSQLQSLQARKNQMRAKAAQARADVESAQVMIGYARISSPFNGIVTSKHADVGQLATPGLSLLTLESNEGYQLEASVKESVLSRVNRGQTVLVQIDSLGPQEITGTVSEILPTADASTRSFIVKINLAVEGGQALRSGLYGKARFAMGQKQALTIPQSAIIRRGQLIGLYVVSRENLAQFRLVKTGSSLGDRVEVLSGLNEGERIVTVGVDQVSEGSRIE